MNHRIDFLVFVIFFYTFVMISPVSGDSSLPLIMTGSGTYSQELYGNSVSCSGDLNGDGYFDVIVGAPQNDLAANNAGAVFIYWGGPQLTLDDIPDVVLTGPHEYAQFGRVISCEGDLNGDEFDDLIVGVPAYNSSKTRQDIAGRAQIFFGSETFDTVADWTVDGAVANAELGFRACFLGDVSGDLANDFALSYLTFEPEKTWHIALFYGGSGLDTTPDALISQPVSRFDEAFTVSPAGDFNADGVGDVLIGSSIDYQTYLYYGGGDPFNTSPQVTFTGEVLGDGFGYAVAGKRGCDFNHDGADDIVISAPQADTATYEKAGKVYVYFGSENPDATVDLTYEGDQDLIFFGGSLSVGRILADYTWDIVVGAYLYGSPNDIGAVYIFSPATKSALFLQGETNGDGFGYALDIGGDCNDDSSNDLLISAFYFGVNNNGKAYLYSGQPPDVPALGHEAILIVMILLSFVISLSKLRGLAEQSGDE
ncbi:integrin alpha [candidate division CSSED10-310 bacterium]|uniref:Integrin alpha n=1 Tax=candidate division CSSED10-310 bacterium TaxID=2855610 RepID=A0ABV6Z0L3_UNCC1